MTRPRPFDKEGNDPHRPSRRPTQQGIAGNVNYPVVNDRACCSSHHWL